MNNLYEYENKLYSQGFNFIAGIDEVGRGPLIGPVVAACVILPVGFTLPGLTDSKKLSRLKRELFYSIIYEQAIGIGIGIVSAKQIDKINILKATKLAMKKAISNTKKPIDYLLIDAVKLDVAIPSISIIKGDNKSISIAAASVIAKVTRDRLMDDLDLRYPEYDFKHNKGYPTKKHLAALLQYGPVKEHRKTFKPVASILDK